MATRARTTPLGFAPPAFGEEERTNVLRSLETGWLTSGPFATQLEEEFAAYAGVEHAFAVSSCTTAMHLALVALGIGAGDEVLTTPITWPATANVIVQTGAKPVFKELGITSLDALRAACQADQVSALKGFGKKTQEKILAGIDMAATAGERMYWAHADEIVQQLLAHMRQVKGIRQIEAAAQPAARDP